MSHDGLGARTLGQLVADKPERAGVFEALELDYCCRGDRTLEAACAEKGISVDAAIARLEAARDRSPDRRPPVDAAAMSLTELADHIEATHHQYLREELPSLHALIRKVAVVHGQAEPRLAQVEGVFSAFIEEIFGHMFKEERILFPLIRRMESAGDSAASHCGSIANPIRVMEAEHDSAGDALGAMRNLTDGFSPPAFACESYRALLARLTALETDMHQHIHKENNVLFPRAQALESELQQAVPAS